MSQRTLKQLSAVYERPIKVGMNTPPKRQAKATQVEQHVQHFARNPKNNNDICRCLNSKEREMDKNQVQTSTPLGRRRSPLKRIGYQKHTKTTCQKTSTLTTHLRLSPARSPLREGVVCITLVIKTHFKHGMNPDNIFLIWFFFLEKQNARLS